MFETSVVKARAAAAQRRVGLFTVSVALHSVAAVAIVAASVATVSFPRTAPDQYEVLQTAAPLMIPPPLGNPNGGAPKPPDVKPAAAPVPTPQQDTAPQAIPDNTTPAPQPGPSDTNAVDLGPGDGTGTEPGPRGVWDGDPNVPDVGQPIVSTPGTGAPTGPLVPGGEVKSAVVLRRVEPVFPNAALTIRKGGTVVVQCVIDRSGTCQNPRVIRSTFAMFDQPVLTAVKQWKFLPGSLRGQPVDTYFELTVTFTAR